MFWRRIKFRYSVLFVCATMVCMAARGAEVTVGFGYSEQVGNRSSQDNGVVDLGYHFYDTQWRSLEFTLGAGASWMWTDFSIDSEMFMVSILPTLRWYPGETKQFKFHVFHCLAPAYLSNDSLGQQRLGGQFAFSHFLGLGAYMGQERNWNVSFCWRHISNGGLFEPNEGIDVTYCCIIGRHL